MRIIQGLLFPSLQRRGREKCTPLKVRYLVTLLLCYPVTLLPCYLVTLLLGCLLISCNSHDYDPVLPDEEEAVRMPVYISIPAEGEWNTRATGDPGIAPEGMRLPRYAYLYLYTEYNNGIDLHHLEKVSENLDASNWTLEPNPGPYQTTGDSIYVYNKPLYIELPSGNRKAGRIYAILSYEDLSTIGTIDVTAATTTEENLIDLQADFSDINGNYNYLKDIYTTPYNYNIGTDNHYYGTVSGIGSNVPSASLMLYHLAAKVDIMWNVDEAKQSSFRIASMQIQNMKHNNCHLFKPNENTVGTLENLYTETVSPINPGNQWYGRYTTYTIPYTSGDNYPISIRVNDGSTNRDHTVNIPYTTLGNQPFTPWVRADVIIE